MLVSAVIHPVYLASFILLAADPLALWTEAGAFGSAVIGANLFNLAAGYLAVALLTERALALRGRSRELPALIGLPVYWLLMAVACVRALFQLVVKPHLWEKTPHVGVGLAAEPSPPTSAGRPTGRRASVADRPRSAISGGGAQA
jgi:hypothetical protein